MRTNIEIDEGVILKAIELSGLKTKKAVVDQALKDFLAKQSKLNLLKLEGKLEWEGNLSDWRNE
ncbi:MAG: type II toxin-antitoxin system VapB family antitoxin [Bacteroidetes bacterium]|nr:type II toxin-antitoxin system VapB family antitoxin [Bacteroidota bacterium]